MAQSMTGFGKAEVSFLDKRICVEIRSVNSKQLDASIKLPSMYREYEMGMRTKLAQVVQRGKLDVYVSYAKSKEAAALGMINEELLRNWFVQLKKSVEPLGLQDVDATLLKTALRMPDVFTQEMPTTVDPGEMEAVRTCFETALVQFVEFRQQEGAVLMHDLLGRVNLIESLLDKVEPYENERIGLVRERLEAALSEIKSNLNKDRLEQEMIYYLEKLDVTEEKVRLRKHCQYFKETATEEASGRKLGFITQEMGREINTLGSKANHSQIQAIVVLMKDELEKIKEQVLNIL